MELGKLFAQYSKYRIPTNPNGSDWDSSKTSMPKVVKLQAKSNGRPTHIKTYREPSMIITVIMDATIGTGKHVHTVN